MAMNTLAMAETREFKAPAMAEKMLPMLVA
jgi:hypothetical protein